MSWALDTLLQARDIPWRQIAGETVLLDHEGNVILGLNKAGGRVWELLDGKRTLDAIAIILATEYERPIDGVRQDVIQFAELLAEKGLVAILSAKR